MNELSKTQRRIYEFIKDEISKKGMTPSIREIGQVIEHSSTSSISYQLNKLEEKGYIRRPKFKKRCIEILENDFYDKSSGNNSAEFSNIPIIGTVSAGLPIFADENVEGYFPVPVDYLPNSDTFMLRIQGNSMINSGIFNNDLVLVKQQPIAQNGDIIIALIDDSATCKTFYKEKEFIRLQPQNDAYEPIFVKDCKILGKVIGLFRSF